MDMNNSEQKPCSFFMLFEFDNFTHELLIPPQFVKNQAENLCRNAKLRSDYGDLWHVKIEKQRKNHFFTDGWKKFAEDVELKNKDFLLFKLVGKSTFNVSVYGKNGSQKEFCSTEGYSSSNSVSRNPNSTPSFFKVFFSDVNGSQFSIPPAIVRKYGSIFPENATIRINSGETLKVKLEQLDDMKYWFTNGWNTFTNDVGLEMGAFLVFWYIGHSIFDVSVFGISGCERVFSVHNNPTESDPDEFGVSNEVEATRIDYSLIESDKSNPHFEFVLVPHQRSRVHVRMHFVEEAGLIGRRSVSLEYEGGFRVDDVVLDKREVGVNNFRLELIETKCPTLVENNS